MKILTMFLIAVLIMAPVNCLAEENKWARLVERSGVILGEMQEMPDEGIPEDLLRKCHAIAIFPDTVSAGFGIGGKYGQGVILVRDKSGRWSPPAIFTIVGGSLGWQIGGQATDIVLLAMSKRSVDAVLKGKFKLGVDAAVSVGPVGREAAAATDARLGGILSYSRSRGLFAGVKLGGDVITQHWEGNEELYRKKLSAESILLDRKARMPRSAKNLIKMLNKYPYKR